MNHKCVVLNAKKMNFDVKLDFSVLSSDVTVYDDTTEQQLSERIQGAGHWQESYNTKVAVGGTNLSGGQRQRISIARATSKRKSRKPHARLYNGFKEARRAQDTYAVCSEHNNSE